MIIKASSTLCNGHVPISNIAKEQMLQLREKVLKAEQERIDGAETLSVSQARKQLIYRMKYKIDTQTEYTKLFR